MVSPPSHSNIRGRLVLLGTELRMSKIDPMWAYSTTQSLQALPYIGRSDGADGEGQANTHAYVEATA